MGATWLHLLSGSLFAKLFCISQYCCQACISSRNARFTDLQTQDAQAECLLFSFAVYFNTHWLKRDKLVAGVSISWFKTDWWGVIFIQLVAQLWLYRYNSWHWDVNDIYSTFPHFECCVCYLHHPHRSRKHIPIRNNSPHYWLKISREAAELLMVWMLLLNKVKRGSKSDNGHTC